MEGSRLRGYRGMESTGHASSGVLEDAAISGAEIAVIDYRSAARNVRVVVVHHYAAVPVGRPGVISPPEVSEETNSDADAKADGKASAKRHTGGGPPQ